MKKIIITLPILFSVLFNLSAQNKYDYNWQMGYSYWRPKEPSKNFGFSFNFNNSKVKLDTFSRNFDIRETSISISDKNGNFLFTSNGCRFYNKNLVLMENGDSINTSSATDGFCKDRYGVAIDGNILTQGMIALPQAENDSIFYVFHQRINDVSNFPLFGVPDRLYYSVINVNTKNGLGSVITKNKEIIRDTLEGNTLATKHANGKDWWVIVRKFRSNTLYTLKFTKTGIDTLFSQQIGNVTAGFDLGGGQGCFTPDGTKFTFYSERNDVMIYDFDRNTGKLSNFRNYPVFKEPYSFGGAAISANSRFLYVFTQNEVNQFDLNAVDIGGSNTVVARQNGLMDPFLIIMCFAQLAPDCKIYFNSPSGAKSFGYIRYPDRKGVACQVVQGGIKLPYSVAISSSLPNNPNYRLGVAPTYPCDSTIDFRVPTKETFTKINVNVFPNPSTGNVTLDWDDGINTEGGNVRVFNMLGQMVFQQQIPSIETRAQLDLNVPSGVYHIRMNFKENKVFQGRVLIVK
jgi:Secretion system C-terminal sorting domain